MYKVRVVRLMDYGAFVQLPNGFQALLHISELAHHKARAAFSLLLLPFALPIPPIVSVRPLSG